MKLVHSMISRCVGSAHWMLVRVTCCKSDASLRVQGGGLREGLLALQQQADPQRHLVRPAVLAPVVALVRGVAACPEAACLAATLLRGLATAGPSERAGIWCVSTLRPPCLD